MFPRVVQPRHDRTNRTADDLRDGSIVEAVKLAELNNGAMLGRKLLERGVNLLAQFSALRLFHWRRVCGRRFLHARVHIRVDTLLERSSWTPIAATFEIDGEIGGDPINPGVK